MQKPTLNVALMQEKIDQEFGTVAKFARAAGISRQYAHDIVTGKAVPSLTRLAQFADLLSVTVDDLLGSPKGEALGIAALTAQPLQAMVV